MIAGVVQKQKELYEVELGTAVIENYIDSDDKTIFIRKMEQLSLMEKEYLITS